MSLSHAHEAINYISCDSKLSFEEKKTHLSKAIIYGG